MQTSSKTIFLMSLVCFCIFTSYLLYQSLITQNLQVNQYQNHPDTIASNIIAKRFGMHGQLIDQISSVFVAHYPYANISNFNHPDIWLYQTHQAPWHITAKFGQGRDGSHVFQLWDQVVLQQAASHDRKPTTINTHSLRYYPQKNLAISSFPVTIQQPGVRLQALGMTAKLKQQLFRLHHNVYGQYKTQ